MISVLIVADIRLYQEGLARALGQEDRIRVVGAAASVSEALKRITDLRPEVVLVDAAVPAGFGGIRTIVEAAPDVKVVALALPEAEDDVIACAEAGASGYVPREGTIADLGAVIECVTRGEALCSPRMTASLLKRIASLAAERHPPPPEMNLTSREIEIITLIDQGLSNKEIAQRLSIALSTVKNHVHSILDKLHVHRRAEAAERLK
jgi:two-component system, NarL family, nitrate/nitrite response regulator NarL